MNTKLYVLINYKKVKCILTCSSLNIFHKHLLPGMYKVLCSCYTKFSPFVPKEQH